MRGRRATSIVASVVVFVGLLGVGPALGQTTATGALAGIVTDPSGAAVPNVTITVTNPATGQSRTVTSDATGVYRVPLLPPATYSVEFVAPGFKPQVRPGVVVNVAETETLNVTLELGTQKESVTVSGGAALVQTETTTLGHVVDQREVVNLPLVSRNYTQILALSPGVAAELTNALRLRGVSLEMVRGRRDESEPLIRLADMWAGCIRAATLGAAAERALLDRALASGYIRRAN